MRSHGKTYDDLAHLYDVAFNWDVSEEVAWLLERLGPDTRTVLEPACGSGRMFPEFSRRGVDVIGIDISPAMLRRAQERMARLGLTPPLVIQGDMARFELQREVDGAICPINSFGYLLTPEQALAHLQCVARCLKPRSRYLLQVDLVDANQRSLFASSLEDAGPERYQSWEGERSGTRVRTTWGMISFDARTRLQTEALRFEILSGPEAGTQLEDRHVMRKWTWREWCELLETSPFVQTAAYDGNRDRSPLPLDESLEAQDLTWHELELRPASP